MPFAKFEVANLELRFGAVEYWSQIESALACWPHRGRARRANQTRANQTHRVSLETICFDRPHTGTHEQSEGLLKQYQNSNFFFGIDSRELAYLTGENATISKEVVAKLSKVRTRSDECRGVVSRSISREWSFQSSR